MARPFKFDRLRAVIGSYGSVLVAFSGGVDSALVLKVARDVLGRNRTKAVTAESQSVPERELMFARHLARELGVDHHIIPTRELDDERYRLNPANRCYFCKTELYSRLIPLAKEWGLAALCNGTNTDDLRDFRPGLAAAHEHGVMSPLVEADLNKKDIRALSRKLGLPVWSKPASPCLASRLPYGNEITPAKLRQVEAGENYLKDLGFQVVRLRHFGDQAKIELGRDEFVRVMDVSLRIRITEFIQSLGFKTVLFQPYRSGSLNPETGVARSLFRASSENSHVSV